MKPDGCFGPAGVGNTGREEVWCEDLPEECNFKFNNCKSKLAHGHWTQGLSHWPPETFGWCRNVLGDRHLCEMHLTVCTNL